MTLKDAMERADALRPNALKADLKTGWINRLEGSVQTEILKTYPGDGTATLTQYTYPGDEGKELLIGAPYDDVYVLHLAAEISFALQDWIAYSNDKNRFNQAMLEFENYHNRTNLPVQAHSFRNLW